jgi:large subunit ribosomal protein L17
MRHQKKKATLDRKAGPRNAMLRSLAISLIQQGRVTTTPTKARAVRSLVEPLVTRAKQPSVATMRYLEKQLANKRAVQHLVAKVAPQFSDRAGGYTTMVKVGRRSGDGAEQVLLEFVQK